MKLFFAGANLCLALIQFLRLIDCKMKEPSLEMIIINTIFGVWLIYDANS